jgi:hypothetical protein
MSYGISLPEAVIKFKWPNLTENNHKGTSKKDSLYNCVAYAIDDNANLIDDDRKRNWWPIEDDAYYWPQGYPKEESISNFIITFHDIFGFEVCDSDILENKYEKIAIYSIKDEPTHVARQLVNGKWTSKMGIYEDIEHETVFTLCGFLYGEIAVFMRRLRIMT